MFDDNAIKKITVTQTDLTPLPEITCINEDYDSERTENGTVSVEKERVNLLKRYDEMQLAMCTLQSQTESIRELIRKIPYS